MLFPSTSIAIRCHDFMLQHADPSLKEDTKHVRILNLVLRKNASTAPPSGHAVTMVSAVIYAASLQGPAKTFWQHTGDGVSSRRAEFCHRAFDEGYLVPLDEADVKSPQAPNVHKGPRRYQRGTSMDKLALTIPQTSEPVKVHENLEYQQFIEERFGRNLDITLASKAKLATRRRIAGSLTVDAELQDALHQSENSAPNRKVEGFSPEDIFLYPTGMSAISNAHQTLLNTRGQMKSVMFGFPYIDTLKVLEKFGPGCLFYGKGASEDLDNLEARCQNGEKFLALFCEFPGNPLLRAPDLTRIKSLADKYDFAVVVDETVGNFMNIHVLPSADVVVSSLTKVFSGDSNVMGGSMVLNPNGRYHDVLRKSLDRDYEDNYWPEDAIFMERNSRDFVSRIDRINHSAEALCDMLKESTDIKEVYYPKYSPTRSHYEEYKNANGGYGGLFSITFYSTEEAVTFFDAIETAKGPSLGTNFTLWYASSLSYRFFLEANTSSSPFVILAHYHELDWAAQFGVEADLIRVSVGLEDTGALLKTFAKALDAIAKYKANIQE
jgi:cystathionine gamma-synthase